MSNPENAQAAAPGQTIVIDRRERAGCLRRGLGLVLILSIVTNFALASRQAGLLGLGLDETYVAGKVTTANKIAIVEVDGVIIAGLVDHAVKQLRQAREDPAVKAVVLRVDSPGGTVSGSDRIWREVELLKRSKKPVVASMGGIAASGGYYISAPADAIFAEPTTMTGSIGVILELPQISELLDKIGVDFTTIATGEWKDSGSIFRPMTEPEKTRWREMIEHSYQRFVRVVAQGRGLPLKATKELANGKVYTADEALRLKLITAIGYLDDAITDAQSRAGLESARVVRYARPSSLVDALTGLSSRGQGVRVDAESLLRLRTPQMLFLAR